MLLNLKYWQKNLNGADKVRKDVEMKGTFMAKPMKISVMLIDGGESGSIHLHPNQKWEVTFFKDDKTKVGLERDNLSLIIDKELFKERFAVCI